MSARVLMPDSSSGGAGFATDVTNTAPIARLSALSDIGALAATMVHTECGNGAADT